MLEAAMSKSVTIDVDESVLAALGLSESQFGGEARFILAAKLYEMGKLTSGQAARLCGKERVAFLLELPRIGIPVSNLRPEDAAAEIRFGLGG